MHLVEFPSKSIETLVGIFFQYFDEISSLCHWYISEEILERLSQGWLIRCNFLIRFWPLFFWRFFQDHFSKKKKKWAEWTINEGLIAPLYKVAANHSTLFWRSSFVLRKWLISTASSGKFEAWNKESLSSSVLESASYLFP